MDEQEKKQQIITILESKELILTIGITGETKNFKNFTKFEKFVVKEKGYWNNYSSSNLNSVRGFYNQISTYIEQINSLQDKSRLGQKFTELFRYIEQQKINILFANSKIAQFLVRLHEKSIPRCNKAHFTLQQKKADAVNARTVEEFQGILDAQSFLFNNEVDAKEMAEASLAEAASKHNEETEKIRAEFDELKENYDNKLNSSYASLSNSEIIFDEKIKSYEATFKNKTESWEQEKTNILLAYANLLKLEQPSRYWKALEVSNTNTGKNWTRLVLAVSSVFVLFLFVLLYIYPDLLKGELGINQAKGIMIFTIIVSIFSYLIITFVKYATSAFHLANDAKERWLLTNLFLSLQKEGAIDDKEREIVLQSLFSRADTGLIKGESSPTMPGLTSILSRIMEGKQ